jgi:hypothetical protein
VQGEHSLTVGGVARTEADTVALCARLGDVTLEANDDVRLDGERIFLNE